MYFLEYPSKMFFLSITSIQCKTSAIEQMTFGNRPVDRDRRVGHPWCRLWGASDSTYPG